MQEALEKERVTLPWNHNCVRLNKFLTGITLPPEIVRSCHSALAEDWTGFDLIRARDVFQLTNIANQQYKQHREPSR